MLSNCGAEENSLESLDSLVSLEQGEQTSQS